MKPLYDFSSLPIDRVISPRDTMLAADDPEAYFRLGHRALELIHFSAQLCDKPHYPEILDLACGHGRVMRWLRPHYPYARITGCDLDHDAVDFCHERFSSVPVYSSPDLRALPFKADFDLIWVGSLLTHLNEDRWRCALDCLVRWVRECGVIVLSTQGRTVATHLARGEKTVAENIDKAGLLADYRRAGFGYQRYFECRPTEDYGLALSSPSWLMAVLQAYPDIMIRAWLEEAWGMQDVVILYKKAGRHESL